LPWPKAEFGWFLISELTPTAPCRSLVYRCENGRFSLSWQHCRVPTPTFSKAQLRI
jgi:hypothetical protein